MGLADLINLNRWRLLSLDPEVFVLIDGDFPPNEGVETSADPVLSQSSTVGSELPAVQWVSGGPRAKRFASVIRSKHFLDNITPAIKQLESLNQRDSILRRAPRVRFTWGDDAIDGFVTSLRTRIPGLWVSGLPKACLFEIEITRAEPIVLETTLPLAGETQIVVLGDGETFEALGLRYLGDPLLGELLRRDNPEVLGAEGDEEVAGDRIRVVEADHPRLRGEVVPTGLPFLDVALYGPVIDELAAGRGTTTRGLPWRLLPEVVSGEVE